MRLYIRRSGPALLDVEVESYAEASTQWAQWRDAHGIASSTMPGVWVLDDAPTRTRLRVSYNGKIWGAGGLDPKRAALLYDPFAPEAQP